MTTSKITDKKLNLSLGELICPRICVSDKVRLNEYEACVKIIQEKLSVDYILEKLIDIEILKEKNGLGNVDSVPGAINMKSSSQPKISKNKPEILQIQKGASQ